ncbi:unnamed protein product, partial [Amoebophrya sp. A25]
ETLRVTISQVEQSTQAALRNLHEARNDQAALLEEKERLRKGMKSSQTRVATAQARIAALQDRKRTTKQRLEEEMGTRENEFRKRLFKHQQRLRDLQMQLGQGTREMKRLEELA